MKKRLLLGLALGLSLIPTLKSVAIALDPQKVQAYADRGAALRNALTSKVPALIAFSNKLEEGDMEAVSLMLGKLSFVNDIDRIRENLGRFKGFIQVAQERFHPVNTIVVISERLDLLNRLFEQLQRVANVAQNADEVTNRLRKVQETDVFKNEIQPELARIKAKLQLAADELQTVKFDTLGKAVLAGGKKARGENLRFADTLALLKGMKYGRILIFRLLDIINATTNLALQINIAVEASGKDGVPPLLKVLLTSIEAVSEKLKDNVQTFYEALIKKVR